MFLGYKFRLDGSDVHISPAPENSEKFRSKIEWYLSAIEYSGWAADGIAAEARRYVRPWMAAFSLADFAELHGYIALLEIEEARELEERLASMGYPDFDPPLNSIANCPGSQL